MLGDCHIHMILDGIYYRDAIDHHKAQPDEALIRDRLKDYASRGITYLRDGGDAWGVGLRASQVAPEYGICYRTPVFNICRKGHYGRFLGREFADFAEYKALVRLLGTVSRTAGHFCSRDGGIVRYRGSRLIIPSTQGMSQDSLPRRPADRRKNDQHPGDPFTVLQRHNRSPIRPSDIPAFSDSAPAFL